MEKIKNAIDESRRNNVSRKNKNVTNNAVKKDKAHEFGERVIDYEYTKVVKLNPAHLERNRIVSFNKNNNLSISFDILRTQIIDKMLENGWRTLAVTSPVPGCGKSVLSINLAMSIAHQTDLTALLVDFDFRRPTIGKYLGIPSKPSLNDVLGGDASLSDVLINPELPRFVVLPTESPIKHSSETLASKKVRNLVSELRERYEERIVIFDLPPLLSSDDAMIMLQQVDCVLMVVGNGMVSKSELERTINYISPEKLIGTVLNKVDSSVNKESHYNYSY